MVWRGRVALLDMWVKEGLSGGVASKLKSESEEGVNLEKQMQRP